ncbi:hypothetical protein [Cryptosporangium phraense]|uniref:Extracellular solute-binding protein n=1 Tax=Cryptosporangium phraense TaxID=2593070 RepID=A0A545AY47_9ACTN|nr:hypothetical protein [Cryptosporangium phraense]TQS46264.1 hypothetical protein FL583_02390 [Cryptosporangium phraense]
MKRWIGIGLAVVLVVGVGIIALVGRDKGDKAAIGGRCETVTTVRGVVGSEKVPYFSDPRVQQAFASHCLSVQVEPAGSREIAGLDLSAYDFAFPSSAPTGEAIRRKVKAPRAYTPFSSPMAIATFARISDLLTKVGVVHQEGSYQVLDMEKYLALVAKGQRWDTLPGSTFAARKSVLITTTDPRTSNSAAMYASIVSFVANGDAVVQGAAAEKKVLPLLTKVFLAQGYTENSSEGPFENYLTGGVGNTPMVMIYEAQFVDRLQRKDGSINPDMRLLYPSPTVVSKHTLVPLKPPGDQVGKLLTDDPALSELAAEHGFRTNNSSQFTSVLNKLGAAAKPVAHEDIVDVIDPPTYETLEHLLNAISAQYN